MYAREIDGAVHTFGVSGKLIMNVLVMYDHQTRSLWSQFLGQAIEGPKRGVKLDLVPVTQTAWALWTDNHPDTLILDKQGGYRGDSYHYYYRDGQKGVLGESNEDNRLAPKELVVGVRLDGDTKAYPLEALRSQPTVNDSVGGNEVLVFLEINTETALVYDRRVDAMALTFRLLPGGGARPLLMDDETGSTWMALTGLAVDGPLKGAALNRVASHLSFWVRLERLEPGNGALPAIRRVSGKDNGKPASPKAWLPGLLPIPRLPQGHSDSELAQRREESKNRAARAALL